MATTASHALIYLRRAVPAWILGVTQNDAFGAGLTAQQRQQRVQWRDQARVAGRRTTLPRPRLPYIGLQLLGRLDPIGRAESRPHIETAPTSITLTVTASAPGDTLAFRLGYQQVRYVLQAGEDASDARDRALDQISAGVEPVTAAAVGVDQISMTADKPGLMRTSLYLGVTEVVDVSAPVRLACWVQKLGRVRAHLYGFDPTSSVYDDLITAVDDREGFDILQGFGCGMQGPRPAGTDVSVVSGAGEERRTSVDLFVGCVEMRYRTDPIPLLTASSVQEYLRSANNLVIPTPPP